MSSLGELIEAFRSNELKLPALFDALSARGPISDDEYARERAEVERLHGDRQFNPELAQALLAKLESLRASSAAQASAADEDMTAVRPAGPRNASNDATVVYPVARPLLKQPEASTASEPEPEDATMVLPATGRKPEPRPEPNGSDTRVRTSSSPAPVAAEADGARADGAEAEGAAREAGGTSSTSGGTGSSSWKRIGDAAQGEYATVGMLLKGRFLLEREIGRGGMGVVFVARDERKVEARDRDPYVAVKVLNDEFRRHPDSLIALQRESRRSQQLAHDNIVRVYDFDKDGTVVFMTMEYIDGSDLKTLIREQAYNGMPLSKARPLIEGMAWALKRAHTAGVVHSDFKPSNVMVTREGVPKVFDFGIARAGKFQGSEAIGEQTVFDAGTLGALTPAYASLEMLRGGEPTPSDDIYALGCVVFELLTGKHPFDKQSAEVAFKEGRKPPKVPGLTKRQYKTLCDAVAFSADRRLKSTEQLVQGLREIGLRERVGRPLLYAAICVLAIAGVAWGVTQQLHVRHVQQVAARFQPADPQRYADEAQAIAALASLDDNERKQLMLEQGELVQQFLIGRVDGYWDPAKGRRDYASARRVFDLLGRLHLFLPQLDLKRVAMEKEKYDLDHPKPVATDVAASSASEPASAGTAGAAAAAEAEQAAAAAAQKAAAEQAAARAQAERMQQAVAGILRDGERNFAQQKYSAAIANARAALQINPDDPGAKRLLKRAQQAQQRAMSNITIN